MNDFERTEPGTTRNQDGLNIRESGPRDAAALTRLAQRDSAGVPQGRLLVAERGGVLLAAVPLSGGGSIADPFRRTAEAVGLLRLHAAQVRARERRRSARRPLASLGLVRRAITG